MQTSKFALKSKTVGGDPPSCAYSDAIFIQAFPRECTESILEGHVRAFEFFGGVPTRISYDNSKVAVGKIVGREDALSSTA